MATLVTFNGSSYNVPAYNDTGWAQGVGNLSSYLVAISTGCLQTTGGNFTLSADVNFGASFGIVAAYLKSASANIAGAGIVRLASGDAINWRNNANNGNLALSKDTSDRLLWNGAYLVTSSSGTTPTEHRSTFTAGTPSGTYTGSLTVVDLPAAYVANGVNLHVYINGLLFAPTLDYAETSTTRFTMNTPLTTGDRIDALWTTY